MALRSTALALAGAVAPLSACGGEDPAPESGSSESSESSESVEPSASEPSTSEPVSDAAAADAAVAGFYEDFAAGDLEAASDGWTDEYAASSVDDWNESDYGPEVDSCPDLLGEIAEVLAIVGDPAAQLQVTDVRGRLTGTSTAVVDVTLAAADQPETYELTLTPDGWRISGDRAGELAPSES